MSAARRREANRANARASTGPKTRAGKARSAGNARRHGLSLPALRDPALSHEIVALARAIVGAEAGAFSAKVDFRFSAENAATQANWSASQHTGGSTYMERAPARTASSSPAASPPRSSISCARAARASTCCGKTRCAMTCLRAASAAPAWRWSCGPSTATNAARCRGGDGPSSRSTRRRPRLRARTGRRNPPAAQLLAERTQVAKRQQSSTPAVPAVHAGGEGATSCAGSDFAPPGGPA